MNGHPGNSPWFGPERQEALDDVWRVYDANIRLATVLRETRGEPELTNLADQIVPSDDKAAERRAILRRAFAGDWAPYEAGLRQIGADYATRNFAAWYSVITESSRRLIPHLVTDHHAEPERLSRALVLMAEFFERVGETLRTAYMTTRDTMARDSEVRSKAVERVAREAMRASAEQLHHSEETHRVLFEASPVSMLVFDAHTRAFLKVNDSALQMYGYSRDELLGMTLNDVKVDEIEPAHIELAGRGTWSGVRSHFRKDGSVFRVHIASSPLPNVTSGPFGNRSTRIAVLIDVTEKEGLEAQLRQSQKMEAIGSLAGGVAHDFNNLLSVILTYSESAAEDLNPNDPLRDDMEAIREAGVRASALTRQLLAFSRQQVLAPKCVDINAIVSDIEPMLRRLIGEDVELVTMIAPSSCPAMVDRGQIEQVIVNLAVNARDAMPRGGKVTIATGEIDLDPRYVAEHPGATEGRHVFLSLCDDGEGMSKETQARIFEPFFTTKDVDKGTGLGLSTVFGIVRQSGGTIAVRSELGVGTTFSVYLPIAATDDVGPPLSRRRGRVPGPGGGSETILLVEDDAGVRGVARILLVKAGYRVLEAHSGDHAISISIKHDRKIDLLLTDVVMPRMSGRELVERLRPTRPTMKILYMSGYTDDLIVRHGILDASIDFLQKPITSQSLMRKVREVLDALDETVDCNTL